MTQHLLSLQLPSLTIMTLKTQHTTSTTPLNPSAPEYNPIPPGITPRPNPPPLFLLPPPTAFPPPPLFLSNTITTYIPPIVPQHTRPYHAGYFINSSPRPPLQGRGPASHRWRPTAGGGAERNPRRVKCDDKRRHGDHKFPMQRNGKRRINEAVPLRRGEPITTVMIKNIPYECPRKELINLMDRFCSLENAKASNEGTSEEDRDIAAYDFLYLPMDFRSYFSTQRSRGFAFVNFTKASAVWKFHHAFHLKNWDFLQRTRWTKKIEVVTAKIQGKEALVSHFSQSIFYCESDEYLPVTFAPARDGLGQPGHLTAIGFRGLGPVRASPRDARSNHKR